MEHKFILIKYLVHQEDIIIIIYIYAHYNIGSKTIKESQELIILKVKIMQRRRGWLEEDIQEAFRMLVIFYFLIRALFK